MNLNKRATNLVARVNTLLRSRALAYELEPTAKELRALLLDIYENGDAWGYTGAAYDSLARLWRAFHKRRDRFDLPESFWSGVLDCDE